VQIAVAELNLANWSCIETAGVACAARLCRVNGQCDAKTVHIERYDAAIVELGAGDGLQHSLTFIADARAADMCVIAHAAGLNDWPLNAKCKTLLAGARYLLDNSSATFDTELRNTLTAITAELRAKRDDDRRLRELARRVGIVGESRSLMSAFQQLLRVGKLSDLPVLITGESGTGKELFAAAIHSLDPKRAQREMIAVNCAAVASGVAESELFGHTRGAFTGAANESGGLFLAADGGVLFLDEVGELGLDMQAKLLRVLQEKRVRKVGAGREVEIDVRVVAATNQDLPALVAAGRFRNDLFHRLNVLSLHISPLRERAADLPSLVNHFVAAYDAPGHVRAVDADFIGALSKLRLSGNVRELKNLIAATLAAKADCGALALGDLPTSVWRELLADKPASQEYDATLPARDAPKTIMAPPAAFAANVWESHGWNLNRCLAHCEREIVQAALLQTGNNQSHTAKLLGITARSVYNKVRKHGLETRREN